MFEIPVRLPKDGKRGLTCICPQDEALLCCDAQHLRVKCSTALGWHIWTAADERMYDTYGVIMKSSFGALSLLSMLIHNIWPQISGVARRSNVGTLPETLTHGKLYSDDL